MATVIFVQVKEGGVTELTPPLLDALDLDVPADVLTFMVVEPPGHGRLIHGVHGDDAGRYRDVDASLLHRISSFTLQDLRQGGTSSVCPLSVQ